MKHHAELVDLDYATDLLEESLIIETIREGELLLHTFKHPDHGLLNAMQAGRTVLIVEGEFLDLRGLI
jgi:hypothetical protein